MCSGADSPRTVNGTSGCGKSLPKDLKAGGDRVNFTDFPSESSKNDPLRAYSVMLPANFSNDVPAPLIIGFHGRGQTNDGMKNTSRLSDPFFNSNAITVYPMGINVSQAESAIFCTYHRLKLEVCLIA